MKKVLVVDDDPEILQYTTTTLNRGGIPAMGAHSASEALVILSGKHGVRLLLTDIVMPRTTGLQLAAEVKTLNSELPIVFMTGYMTDHLEQFGEALQGRRILGKPFTPAELLQAVRDALGLIEKAKSA